MSTDFQTLSPLEMGGTPPEIPYCDECDRHAVSEFEHAEYCSRGV